MAGEIKFLRFSDGTTVTAPSALTIDIAGISSYADPAAFVAAKGSAAAAGDIFFNSTENAVNYYDGTSWQTVVDILQGTTGTENNVPKFTSDGRGLQDSGVTIDASDNVTGVNNLTVGGDLTVSGSTTTINTTTLDVEDTNITVNKGGNDAASEGAGLTVERTSTDGSLVYEDSLASKFKIGALGAEVEVADISSAQQLSSKELGDGLNFEVGSATIASNTFAKPSGTIIEITSGTGPLNTITGAVGDAWMYLYNDTGADIVLANDVGVGGFLTGTGADLTLEDKRGIALAYRSGRWRPIASTTNSNHDNLPGFVAAEHIDWSSSGPELIDNTRVGSGAVTQYEGSLVHDNLSGGSDSSGVHGVTGTVVGTTDVQTLEEKTLGNNTKLEEANVSVVSTTFAAPTAVVAKITAADSALGTITGATKEVLVLFNTTGSDLTITDGSGVDTINTGTGADLTLANDASILIVRSSTTTQWNVVGGSGSGSGWNTTYQAGTYSLSNNDEVLASITANATFTLPAGSADGDRVRIIDVTGNFSTYTVTVSPTGGDTINDSADLTMDVDLGHVELVYNSTDGDWEILALYAGAGSGGSGSSWTYTYQTGATYTAAVDENVAYNTTGQASTLTLPASPSDGDRVRVFDSHGTWSSNNLTVARNGNNIQGQADDLIIDVASVWAEFVYVAASTDWRILGPLSEDVDSTIGQTMIFRDEKTSGTDGGSAVSGSFGTRTLNTTYNDQSWGSLSSNQLTLTAGTYEISGFAPAYQVGNHQCKLRNITDSSDALFGQSAYTSGADGVQTNTNILGTITITASKTFELQHRCAVAKASNGFGANAGYGLEVYSTLAITKLSN